jgi:hypothetical protein
VVPMLPEELLLDEVEVLELLELEELDELLLVELLEPPPLHVGNVKLPSCVPWKPKTARV